MKKVICINDKQLPLGAEVVEGEIYTVRDSFINGFDQRAYFLVGVRNKGRTKFGLPWNGYNAERFQDVESVSKEESQVAHMLN
jgi:hypothetical protein|tara:strand:- start:1118 stop:1366 length:249 start_codon:yes stop_codon:yes gene_type:complete